MSVWSEAQRFRAERSVETKIESFRLERGLVLSHGVFGKNGSQESLVSRIFVIHQRNFCHGAGGFRAHVGLT